MNVREVVLTDDPALQRLMLSNAGYTRRVEGGALGADAAREVLSTLPPGAGANQKWGLGVWEGDLLVAFADVIVGWPDPATAHIGLLMTDGAREGQGLGRTLHTALVEGLIDLRTVTVMRLSIVDTNASVAEPFWKKIGYIATGDVVPYAFGTVSSIARIWTRPLVVM
ncbi:N-acetyltransferase [Arthrobacter alpinus]|uniref:GNAT family acetyltransferase n=1 Tax=Arthrobacter alpinus TaxID=656366 RepID=A0A0S2LXK8_9MICC|nr:GNAT family N-acetyltransferase [Arthrobacter alpinus]ALO66143.1 GNAT family acetyltransferase [Arthrobacter alpinus]MDD0859004.1 N-acetyltransferase [Arthrobacter alpinus]